ncbi:MAG TPA: hypothetical protein VFQ76_14390 [Longimicrobiaceae bacterium]|nr:hypothetical protein [Longimicrobiaceae bacterium]
MHRIARKLVPALAALAFFAAPGCADRGAPTALAPATAPSFGQGGSPNLASVAKYQQRPSLTVAWAKKWIGPEGGRLDFQGFAIVVPAGAVDRVTQFSISLPVDPQGSEHVMAEFGPHNQLFARPVAIELPFRGTSIEGSTTPTIVWWNDEWVNMGASLTTDGLRLMTQTHHFSTYATTSDFVARSGVVTTSGG